MVFETTAILISAALALSGCGSAARAAGPTTVTLGPASVGVGISTPSGTGSAGASTGTATAAASGSSTASRITSTPGTSASIGPPPTNTYASSLAHLRATVHHYAGALGPHAGILVQDLTANTTLYSQNPTVERAPASVEKLYTSAAMLWTYGPDAVLHTEVLGVGHLAAKGVWVGNLFLRGDGDPTFGDKNWQKIYEDRLGSSASSLVVQLRAAGIRHVTGHLYADPSIFDSALGGPSTGDAPDVPDYGGELSGLVYDHGYNVDNLGPAVTSAHMLAVIGAKAGVHVHTAPRPGVTPAGAHVLASVSSPPLSEMLPLMDIPSDDLFADLFAKQMGHHLDDQGTLAAGAEAIAEQIQQHYGLTPTIHDGSGLDKSDRSSPVQIVSLLAQLNSSEIGPELRDALPVVGKSGTVASIGLKTPAVGACQAKTGTLNNVTNLAGYCKARNGDTLAFAILADGPANWAALGPIGKIVGEVAYY